MSRWKFFLLTVIVALIGSLGGYVVYSSLSGAPPLPGGPPPNWGVLEKPVQAPDFILYDAYSGGKFALSSQLGKVVLVFFGYTNCPDVCPLTLMMYHELYERIKGTQLKDKVAMVFITTDPYRDTFDAMKGYAEKFGTPVAMLSGDLDELKKVYSAYGVYVKYTDETGKRELSEEEVQQMAREGKVYFVTHSSQIYVIDGKGLLRGFILVGTEVEDVLRVIEYVLRT